MLINTQSNIQNLFKVSLKCIESMFKIVYQEKFKYNVRKIAEMI